MRSLPEWFGLEEPLLHYVEAARTLPTLIASEANRDVGFLTIKQHTAGSAEILAMGFPTGTVGELDESCLRLRQPGLRPATSPSCR
jgi:hypothetical protein